MAYKKSAEPKPFPNVLAPSRRTHRNGSEPHPLARKDLLYRLAAALFVAAYFLLTSTPTIAKTWYVTPNSSIQSTITTASTGDTILVFPGQYFEVINFLGKDIILKSTDGPNQTIIDGTGSNDCVVRIENGESQAATLEGFTIQEGKGGVCLYESEATIRGNVVTHNSGGDLGAGIACTGLWTSAHPPLTVIIEDNSITENAARISAPAIWIWGKWSPIIRNNSMLRNEALLGDGGAVYMYTSVPGAIITANLIEDNTVGDHGGGIYAGMPDAPGGTAVTLEISFNVIARNKADAGDATGNSGGGIWLARTNAWVHNNTIVQNFGGGSDNTWGGGIALDDRAFALIERNIIAFNEMGGALSCLREAAADVQNNLIWNNVGGYGNSGCGEWGSTNGNVEADPFFCDLIGGNFGLAENSPAITHISGPLGALGQIACGPVSVRATTWGHLKQLFKVGRKAQLK